MLANTREAVDCAVQKDVEPATRGVDRNFDFLEPFFIADRLPVIIVGLMFYPIAEMRDGVTSRLQIDVTQWKMAQNLAYFNSSGE